MANNQMQTIKASQALTSSAYQNKMMETLQDPKRVQKFTNAVVTAIAQNRDLQECEPATVLSCALRGESLNLIHSPQMGQYYMVPFKNKKAGTKLATFILGYKGMIQLAKRSGQYKKINVLSLKKGELIKYDPLEEEIEAKLIENDTEREKAETIGYYAFFEEINGFRKAIYWSKEKMLAHADNYSPAFNAINYQKLQDGKVAEEDMWKYSSYWYKDFDGMARKTMLRQLISKWGTMSIELSNAIEADGMTINQDLNPSIEESYEIEIEDTPTETSEMVNEKTGEVLDVEEVNIDEL